MYEREEDDDEEAWLQLRPVEPLPSQCCGGGCSPCVFDLYHRDLARWEAARASKDRSLLGGEESQNCPSHLSPETFLAFRISAMDRLTKDTYRVRFALPRNSQLGLRPGQHLILRGIVNDLEVQRAYTPISPANAEGYFEVLIKCYQTGLMSQYVESWRAGDTAFWRGPFGGFFYQPNQESSPEQLPWSYREKTRFGRLAQDLIEELVGSCRRKPFALVWPPFQSHWDTGSCTDWNQKRWMEDCPNSPGDLGRMTSPLHTSLLHLPLEVTDSLRLASCCVEGGWGCRAPGRRVSSPAVREDSLEEARSRLSLRMNKSWQEMGRGELSCFLRLEGL
ncbi:NADH-cytochrome b5 reductase-like isoform X5 [Equus przewalskii]|uniref:NADH-cytochrome b5 reductase-like isoform X5 n=1 Tax=Equus przewalskii TaxID=9798 RepID=A0ABM4NL01_EQUPR|nr:NADH-cytochrome b5 reductase-like isoform X5 [Equus caballus]